MSERYWITGAQMGTILALGKGIPGIEVILDDVFDGQFIGNVPKERDYKIIIKEE